MSDTARPKSSGDKLSAEEVNQDLPIQMTTGESINGATLPVAVYIKDADGEVYACDADDQDALEFSGFAVSNGTDGNPITVQTKGIVSGFTGLDAGKKYYVQDDKTIGTSIGTYEVLVGIAISSTQILIMKGSFEYMGSASIATNDDTSVPDGARFAIIVASISGTNCSGQGVVIIAKKGATSATIKEMSSTSIYCAATYTWGAGVITNTVAASEAAAQSATAYFYR